MKADAKWELEPGLRARDVGRDGEGWIVSALGVGTAECPDCHASSTRRHGWQLRRLQDLPVQGRPVSLQVRVARWRCQNRCCERQTFTDRLPRAAPPFARRTSRVAELARLVGHAAGGLPSERLLTRLGLPQSDDTLLRNLKRHAADRGETSTARIVGIDDWAWQKGCRYGTIMVDLERREVVDVLSDRSADSVARWLRQHASVEIVSRDRCGLYAEGARRGAPKARQVADRFHLVQNLRHTIEQQLSRAPSPARPLETTNADVDPCTLVASGSPYSWSELAEHRQLVRDGRRALRTSMFDQVKTLQARGDGIRTIACRTGLNWRTVEKWSRLEELPPRNVMGPKLTTPSTFQGHLSRRWAEGCTSGRTLLPEIKRLGYAGSFSHLERLLCQWRKAGRSASASASASAAVDVITLAALAVVPEVAVATTGPLASPIVAAALCVKPRGLLTRTQAAEVDALKAASSDFAAMRGLAMRFRGILRGRDIRPFAAWLQDADRCGIYGMRRFVRTLRQDLDAVRNAITELWSNGQTEGQINRLKTLKRAMYGRAGAELLRARMMPLRLAENHAD